MADPEPDHSDAQLVRDSLAGDRTAFGLLVRRHRATVSRVLRAMFGNLVGVEDLVQDSFLQAYLNLPRLRHPARFGAWVRGIAVNLARMELRSGRLHLSWEDLSSQPHGPQPSPERLAERRELARRIRRAIDALPPAEREAIRHVYLDERSHRQAAGELNTSVGAVKVRVHRARQRLRRALGPEFSTTKKPLEETMIEVTVHDVLVKQVEAESLPQVDFTKPMMEKGDEFLLRMKLHRVVLLREKDGPRILPIWTGPAEGEAIVIHLRKQALGRPITFDLMTEIFAVGNLKLQSAAVSRFHERVFYGTLHVQTSGDGLQEIDCRPSDAVNVALRMDAPIYVASDVMDQLAVTPREGQDLLPRDPGETWVSLLNT